MDSATEYLKGIGRLLYITNPTEHSFPTLEQLPKPDYFSKAVPYFFALIAIENVVLWLQKRPTVRLNDGIVSLSHGMFLGCGQIIVRGIESFFYVKVYENWRFCDLPWDSPYTWYLAAVITDFCFYWLHRAAHEVNIFWAQHQVHHSSEDYNLTTGLRQSALQGWIGWIFYLPMAFFVPPPIYIVHLQFNILFQFWIHTEVIDSLGPLEYIFNTPRHHRIHHGSNRYCLDKNYAGTLIIWDKLFGTFAEEKPGETIIYGLVEEVNSFNPFYLQFFKYKEIWNKAKGYTTLGDKFSSYFKGPGWTAGKPRLGDINDVPQFPIRPKYDQGIPWWQNVYVCAHFAVSIFAFDILTKNHFELSQLNASLCACFVAYSLTSIGFLLEGRKIGAASEVLRCIFCMLTPTLFSMDHFGSKIIYEFFTLSTAIMVYVLLFGETRSGVIRSNKGHSCCNGNSLKPLSGEKVKKSK